MRRLYTDSCLYCALTIVFFLHAGSKKDRKEHPLATTDLFEDEEVEEDHAEVVDDEGFAELEGFSVLHVLGPQPEKEQVGGADGQCGQGVVHQRPFLHPLVCGTQSFLPALHNVCIATVWEQSRLYYFWFVPW